MKSVVLCGSRRFKKEIREFAAKLKHFGVVVYEPILFDSNEDTSISVSEKTKYLRRCGVTLYCFAQIRKADVCFIYNKEGYIGVSTTLEMGFAPGRDRPIYALEKDTVDPSRGVLIDEIIPTAEELLKKLRF